MEKARKESLCYGCGLPGHQARNCRKQQQGSGSVRPPRTKIQMMRSGNADKLDQEGTEPKDQNEVGQMSTGVTSTFEGLTLDDFATEPSDGESSDNTLEDFEERVSTWKKDVTASTIQNRPHERVRGYVQTISMQRTNDVKSSGRTPRRMGRAPTDPGESPSPRGKGVSRLRGPYYCRRFHRRMPT